MSDSLLVFGQWRGWTWQSVGVLVKKNAFCGGALRALTALLTSATYDVLCVPASVCVSVCVGLMHEKSQTSVRRGER